MSALDDLRAARALIADPTRWTQGAYARNADGQRVSETDRKAVCWCAIGALMKTSTVHPLAFRFLREAIEYLYGRAIATPYVNDEFGHAAVLRMYDRAIELAEADHG